MVALYVMIRRQRHYPGKNAYSSSTIELLQLRS